MERRNLFHHMPPIGDYLCGYCLELTGRQCTFSPQGDEVSDCEKPADLFRAMEKVAFGKSCFLIDLIESHLPDPF